METLDRMKQLVEEISDRQKELDKINLQILNEVGESVSKYLKNKLKDTSMGSFYDQVEIKMLRLFRGREFEVNEDFESDTVFLQFLVDLASLIVSVMRIIILNHLA